MTYFYAAKVYLQPGKGEAELVAQIKAGRAKDAAVGNTAASATPRRIVDAVYHLGGKRGSMAIYYRDASNPNRFDGLVFSDTQWKRLMGSKTARTEIDRLAIKNAANTKERLDEMLKGMRGRRSRSLGRVKLHCGKAAQSGSFEEAQLPVTGDDKYLELVLSVPNEKSTISRSLDLVARTVKKPRPYEAAARISSWANALYEQARKRPLSPPRTTDVVSTKSSDKVRVAARR